LKNNFFRYQQKEHAVDDIGYLYGILLAAMHQQIWVDCGRVNVKRPREKHLYFVAILTKIIY